MSNNLNIDCEEWREISSDYPTEMEVIVEMMIECDEELCYDEAA